MNKQIDRQAEMLKIIEDARETYANDVTDHTENEYIREGFLNANYRKTEDVAREIFSVTMQAIEMGVAKADAAVNASAKDPAFREVLKHTGEMYSGYIGKAICEVFKKYESEGEE